MPIKVFKVASGHEVVKGFVTYGPGLIFDVEKDESIEIFSVSQGKREVRLGRLAYADLVPGKPPRGLTVAD